MNEESIPVNQPVLDGNEKKYLIECIDSGWISSEGPYVKRFEDEFSTRVGRQYGIAVCNGSAALDIAVTALGIGPGDEVILPAFTIISCATSIVRAGAIPVVVDCDPVTWNMDVNLIEAKITRKTTAIMVVHIYGLPVDMDPILTLTEKYNLKLIEDAAEVHGQTYKGKPCGSFGDASIFSFYPNKHITTGEGGMVVVDKPELADKCRSLRNLCFKEGKRFEHDELGWNFRMSNLQAAVGLAQLEQLTRFIEKKRQMGILYMELLSDVSGLQLPLLQTDYAKNIYWVFGVVLKDEVFLDAIDVISKMADRRIGSRPFFTPMHKQPVFIKRGLFTSTICPVSENIARKGFYLPSGLAITEEQQHRVVSILKELIN